MEAKQGSHKKPKIKKMPFSQRRVDKDPPSGLTDPLGIFIAGQTKTIPKKKQILTELSKHANITNLKMVKHFGFIVTSTVEDTKKLLALSASNNEFLAANHLILRPGKKQFFVPGSKQYKITEATSCYDLSPSDLSQPSIHMLNDDTLLQIFKYFTPRQILRFEGVCRRFQDLVGIYFRDMARECQQANLCAWMLKLDMLSSHRAWAKGVLLVADLVKHCVIEGHQCSLHQQLGTDRNFPMRVLSQVCFSLESLDLNGTCHTTPQDLKKLIMNNPALKKFRSNVFKLVDWRTICFMLETLPQLETLDVDTHEGTTTISADDLPPVHHLKELKMMTSYRMVKILVGRCPHLEHFNYTFNRVEVNCDELITILKEKCPKLYHLKLNGSQLSTLPYWPQLKELALCDNAITFNSLESTPNLEEVTFSSDHFDAFQLAEPRIFDFSLSQKLKCVSLVLDSETDLNLDETLLTLKLCPLLESLNCNVNKSSTLRVIRNLPQLKNYCSTGCLISSSDIAAFVSAAEHRTSKLNMSVLMKISSNEIATLEAANYHISHCNSQLGLYSFYFEDDSDFDNFDPDFLDLMADDSFDFDDSFHEYMDGFEEGFDMEYANFDM